jgi:hypothetical protein
MARRIGRTTMQGKVRHPKALEYFMTTKQLNAWQAPILFPYLISTWKAEHSGRRPYPQTGGKESERP